jgi:hypothetical protein
MKSMRWACVDASVRLEDVRRRRVGRVGPMGKIPDALRARLAKRGIEVPTDGDGDGTMSKRARGG